MTIRIDDITFRGDDGHDFVWDAGHDLEHPESGRDEGRILVCLDVDGQMDISYADLGSTGDLVGIARAITALQTVHDGLTRVYGGQNDPGACLVQDDWGRCLARHGHDGDHQFPTEESWRALHAPRALPGLAS